MWNHFRWGGQRSRVRPWQQLKRLKVVTEKRYQSRSDQLLEPSGFQRRKKQIWRNVKMLLWRSERVLLLAWLQSRWIHPQHRCWGCFWVSTKKQAKKPQNNKLEKKKHNWPNIAKERHSSTTRGTEKERPELVNAPNPTAHRTKTDLNPQPPRRPTTASHFCSRRKRLH